MLKYRHSRRLKQKRKLKNAKINASEERLAVLRARARAKEFRKRANVFRTGDKDQIKKLLLKDNNRLRKKRARRKSEIVNAVAEQISRKYRIQQMKHFHQRKIRASATNDSTSYHNTDKDVVSSSENENCRFSNFSRKRSLQEDQEWLPPLKRRRISLTIRPRGGLNYQVNIDYESVSQIGQMNNVCVFCDALLFPFEGTNLCCCNGKINIPNLEDPPELIRNLLTEDTSIARQFRTNIRAYNSAFSLTSFGADIIRQSGFSPTFSVLGQVYHRIGSLLPEKDSNPKFMQIYFVDNLNEQAQTRKKYVPNTDIDLLKQLQNLLLENNPYIRDFKRKVLKQLDDVFLVISETRPKHMHRGRFTKPQTDEVAAIVSEENACKRDIIIQKTGGELKRISEIHRSYDPLQYPLLHVYGQDGFGLGLPLTLSNTEAKKQGSLIK